MNHIGADSVLKITETSRDYFDLFVRVPTNQPYIVAQNVTMYVEYSKKIILTNFVVITAEKLNISSKKGFHTQEISIKKI